MNNFDEFVKLWKSETKDIKIENPDLLFLVVYPDKLEWDFSIEKQVQTTTLHVSGGITGAGTGHNVDFCYRNQVNNYLKQSNCTHAMIISVGMVFDFIFSIDNSPITPITHFYDFVKSAEYCKSHIIAKPGKKAFLHHQHINLNVTMWKNIGCPSLNERWDEHKVSKHNYHDDYTPFWIEPKDRPMILNFTHKERKRKSFSYYRDYNDAWNNIFNVWDYVDKNDFYFTRFMTRIQKSFYIFNTESFKIRKKVPEEKFDVLFSPTAGYSAEAIVDKLDFDGEVILYDYVQQNLDLKKMIVEMNMSLEELNIFRHTTNKKIVDNVGNYITTRRASTFGTHERLRKMQARMRDEQDIEYWLMDIISPDYNRLLKKIKGKNVFFDASNIFSYHVSHANYTLYELVFSYNTLKEVLSQSNICWFQGTKPTKQWYSMWI